jgi:hypothetical protein
MVVGAGRWALTLGPGWPKRVPGDWRNPKKDS